MSSFAQCWNVSVQCWGMVWRGRGGGGRTTWWTQPPQVIPPVLSHKTRPHPPSLPPLLLCQLDLRLRGEREEGGGGHTFPWETEFMNTAFWNFRDARARERTPKAGATVMAPWKLHVGCNAFKAWCPSMHAYPDQQLCSSDAHLCYFFLD